MLTLRFNRLFLSIACAGLLLAAADVSLAREMKMAFHATHFAPGGSPIDNPYWPLANLSAGGSHAYMGLTRDECEINKLSDTGMSRVIAGVATSVFRDQAWVAERDHAGNCDMANAQLVEDTLDFYAQDPDGNIWYFGEETMKPDDADPGLCSTEGSWQAGVSDDAEKDPAQPGIVMLSIPRSGLRYKQEFYEDEAEDWAAVMRMNGKAPSDSRRYMHCLVIKEWTPLEPGSIEHKYYCPTPAGGPGLVYIEELKGKTLRVRFIEAGIADDVLPGDGTGEYTSWPNTDALGCDTED